MVNVSKADAHAAARTLHSVLAAPTGDAQESLRAEFP